MTGLHWREPLWLLLGLYPLLPAGWQYLQQRRQALGYADAALLPWVQSGPRRWHRHIRTVLWAGFWLSVAVALAGPRLPRDAGEARTPPRMDMMVVVDVSRSMRTADIVPNRLRRASLELYELLQRVRGSRVGIAVYAARPHLLVPPTADLEAVGFHLRHLDALALPTSGSDAAAALQFALGQLTGQVDHGDALPAVVLWLTDGDIPRERQGALRARVRRMKEAGVPLYILGIGTEDGEAVPLGEGRWLEHRGRTVRSRLDSAFLQELAGLGQGRYSSVRDDASDWDSLYTGGIAQSRPATVTDGAQRQWRELYVWALFPATLLLFSLVSLPRGILPVLALVCVPPPPPAQAGTELEAGIRAYRAEEYADAVKRFSAAVFETEGDEERARALHNLGNSYFQQGDYRAAMQVFRDALTYRPGHGPTLRNLALSVAVQAELESRLRTRERGDGGSDQSGNLVERTRNELDWDQDSTVTWGEGIGPNAGVDLPALPLDDAELQRLIGKGLKRLARHGAGGTGTWNKRRQSVDEARIVLQQMDENPAALWKRLFEIEEGFPAPVKSPVEVPGIQPW